MRHLFFVSRFARRRIHYTHHYRNEYNVGPFRKLPTRRAAGEIRDRWKLMRLKDLKHLTGLTSPQNNVLPERRSSKQVSGINFTADESNQVSNRYCKYRVSENAHQVIGY